MASGSDEPLVQLHGITFPSTLVVKNIQETMSYVPKEGDIILTSYPNAGDDWLQHIVLKLSNRNDEFPGPNVTFKIVPVLEKAGTRVVDNLYDPRIYKHHLPYHMVKKNPLAKCLYIYRNPEDVFASYYFHKCRLDGRKANLEKAFEQFSTGRNMEYGRYFEHARSYFRYQDSPNVLLVSFDKLYHSHEQEVLRISKFLDEEFYDHLLNTGSSLREVLSQTGYENIPLVGGLPHESASAKRLKPNEAASPTKVVGAGKKILTENQIKILHDTAGDVLKALNLFAEPAPAVAETAPVAKE